MRTALLFVCLLHAAQATPVDVTDPVVSLKNGRIRGEYVTVKGTDRRAKQYLGIPFAKAPVGPLRLAAPQDAEPWEGERDCTRQPPMCVQDLDIVEKVSRIMAIEFTPPEISEDCLYLNVYTPAEASKEDKLPVMVWIHGGGLALGAASQFDGAPLAAYENIITVFIQYRLGFLGFLSTGDEHARGNWGFLDQLAALRWVRDNIEAFGGDPQSVTVAGESAGAISASILTLSPRATGLFQRAIFQSGVATLLFRPPSNSSVQIVASLTGCDHSSSEVLVQCLRGKTTAELMEATKKMKIDLGPVVDGVLLNDTAEELLKRKELLKVPVLMGVTNHEFGWILPKMFMPPGWEKGINRVLVVPGMNKLNPSGASGANSLIADEYLKGAKTPQEVRDRVMELMGDTWMTLPVMKVAGYHAYAGAPVYMYEFTYRADMHQSHRPSFVKADHVDDVAFVFGGCFWNGHIKILGNITKDDETLCRTMMTYWANFVRTGAPNGPGLVNWPQYDKEKRDYMELGLTQTVKHKMKEDRVHFFTVTLPQKLQERAAGN